MYPKTRKKFIIIIIAVIIDTITIFNVAVLIEWLVYEFLDFEDVHDNSLKINGNW